MATKLNETVGIFSSWVSARPVKVARWLSSYEEKYGAVKMELHYEYTYPVICVATKRNMGQSRWSSHYKYIYPVKCEALFRFCDLRSIQRCMIREMCMSITCDDAEVGKTIRWRKNICSQFALQWTTIRQHVIWQRGTALQLLEGDCRMTILELNFHL